MQVSFAKLTLPSEDAVAVLIGEDLKLSKKTEELDKKMGGSIKRLIKNKQFKGKKGSIKTIPAPHGIKNKVVIIAGLGKKKHVTEINIQKLGGRILAAANTHEMASLAIIAEDNVKDVANLAYGAELRAYRFDKYHTKDNDNTVVTEVTCYTTKPSPQEKKYKELEKVAVGVYYARDLVTEPPNVLHPETYADRCEHLEEKGLEVKVLGEKEMEQLGMGALLGVGQGSARESKLVIMRWNGDPKGEDEKPIAFVGKGVTFDTGGISLKPSSGMEDMKYDMGGSASVVGVMKALAGRKAKVNAVGVIGLVENMPGQNAQRPSDVVTSLSGQTIEVLNTDAEGRLVLADALWYTQDTFNPKVMINLATLTGAIVVALGEEYAGLFSNNDKLAAQLSKAGEDTEERVWRFPLRKEYDKLLKSPIADMQNISAGRGAGSITAAQFLQRFVNKTPWAHLDIAGMAWTKTAKPICPKGAVGFGVRLLERFVRDNYEA